MVKKKLRDMVVGDKFVGLLSGRPCTVVFIDDNYILYYTEGDSCPDVCKATGNELEMMDPEPEWLYECMVVGNKYSNWYTAKDIDRTRNCTKIKGGRKMHPDKLEIAE